jgi:hypothetical protein
MHTSDEQHTLYTSTLKGLSRSVFPSPDPLNHLQGRSAEYAFNTELVHFTVNVATASLSEVIPPSCLSVLYSTLGLSDETITDAFKEFVLRALYVPFTGVTNSVLLLVSPPSKDNTNAAHDHVDQHRISGLISFPSLENVVSSYFTQGYIYLPLTFSSRYVCEYDADFTSFVDRINPRFLPRRHIHSPMLHDFLLSAFPSEVLAKLSKYDASTYGSLRVWGC